MAPLLVGPLDPLRSDSELFAAALQKASVPAELQVYEAALHAFAQMFMREMAKDAVARVSAFARARVS